MVLFFLALAGAAFSVGFFFSGSLFRPNSSLWFCCRHIVELLSLFIVSRVSFSWDLSLYAGPLGSGTVHSGI